MAEGPSSTIVEKTTPAIEKISTAAKSGTIQATEEPTNVNKTIQATEQPSATTKSAAAQTTDDLPTSSKNTTIRSSKKLLQLSRTRLSVRLRTALQPP